MRNNTVRRLSIVGLSLVLTAGLLVGCSTGDTDSQSADASERQVEKQFEQEHEGQDDAESKHEDDDHHDEEGHEYEPDHERAEHFEGKEAETYDEAVSNMKEANAKLEELLAQDELDGTDFYKIHRKSYTMENALKVIREESDGNYAGVKENLESVHLASEKNDSGTVRQDGEKYLEGAKAMLEGE